MENQQEKKWIFWTTYPVLAVLALVSFILLDSNVLSGTAMAAESWSPSEEVALTLDWGEKLFQGIVQLVIFIF